ncbi:MAG: transporter substrate-binding protein [Hyphomicrobiales bacterium]|nr:transporter substrate-binding protein [Hyphomicrobiales bacterium]
MTMRRRCCRVLLAAYFIVSAASAFALEAVNVGNVSRTLFSVPLWIAQEKGFMRDEGIEATSRILDNAEMLKTQLRSGQVQFVMGTPEVVMMDGYKGGTLRIIAGNTSKLPHFIITRPEIKTLGQLRGANIGILSEKEGTTYIVRDIAKAIGLSSSDYKMTAVGGAPTRWRLLKEGKIDAGLQPFPLSYEAVAAGFNNLGSADSYVPDWQFTSVNVDDTWARAHRNVVVRFLRALKRGRDFMETDADETARIAAKELQTTPQLAGMALAEAKGMKILDPNLDVTQPGLKKVFETLQLTGDIPPDQTFDLSKFTDLTYLQESREMSRK